MGVKVYNPAEVAIIINGIAVSEFGPDSIVAIAKNVDASTQTASLTRGSTTYNVSTNWTGIATVSILANSDTWQILHKDIMARLKDNKPFTVTVMDNNDGALMASLYGCFYKNLPDQNKGAEVDVISLEIWFADVVYQAAA